MSKLARSISALLLSAALLPGAFAADDKDKKVATINGDPIMASELLTYAKVKSPQADLTNADVRKQMIQAYVGRELLYQEAIARKLDKLPFVKLALENQEHEVISQALIATIMQEKPVTEAQVRSYYDLKANESKADFSNTQPLPSYDQVSMQIRQLLMEKNITDYIQTLQKKAKIEVNN